MDQSSFFSSACRHLMVPASFVEKELSFLCPVVHLYGCISIPLICLFLYQSHAVLVTVVSQSRLDIVTCPMLLLFFRVASYYVSSACPFEFYSQLVSFFIKTPKDL